jgi:metal-responsive CopG/Arc/MetJ family transcriptional regulator
VVWILCILDHSLHHLFNLLVMELRIKKKNVTVVNVDLSQDQYRKLKKVADENGFKTPSVLLDDIVHSYLNKNRIRLARATKEFETKVTLPVQISERNFEALRKYSEATKISKTTFIHIILREIFKRIKD